MANQYEEFALAFEAALKLTKAAMNGGASVAKYEPTAEHRSVGDIMIRMSESGGGALPKRDVNVGDQLPATAMLLKFDQAAANATFKSALHSSKTQQPFSRQHGSLQW